MQSPQYFPSPNQRSVSPLKEPLPIESGSTIETLRSISKPSSSKEKVNNWHPYSASVPRSSGSKSKLSANGTSAQDRPTVPYAQLISEAIESTATGRITLNGIYNYVITNYPYFQTASVGWKNSVRHNLSLNKNFVRVPRPPMEKGKGAYWTFSSDKEEIKTAVSRKQPKSAFSASAISSVIDMQQNHLSPYIDVQTFEFQFDPIEQFSSSFQSLYPNANTAFITDESFISTSQQTFANTQQDEFESFNAGKGMYLDQIERMLAIEQMRQSSQTSIETFHTYEDSDAFFTVEKNASDSLVTSSQGCIVPQVRQSSYHQVDYEYIPEHDSSIFWINGVYDSYLGGEKN